MRFLSLGFLCTSVLGLFAPLRLPAQGSAVGGVVVTRASGAPIGAAQVSVSGPTVRAVTDASGRFRIPDVPGTTAVLEVRRIGFRAVQDTVRAGDLNVRIALEENALELSSVVVTGTPAATAQRELGNAESRIHAPRITQAAPMNDGHNLFNGRAAGGLIRSEERRVGKEGRSRWAP